MRGDGDADAALLTPDFLGVYPTGFANRDDHSGQLGDGPTMATYSIEHPVVRVITPDHVLLAYRATFTRTHDGESERMYVSSLWSKIGDEWLNVFSQDTPLSGS